jgi:hypothetical protein
MDMRDDLLFVICDHAENIGDEINPSWKMKTTGK